MTDAAPPIQAESLQAALQREVQRREGTRLMLLFFFFALLAMLAVVRKVRGCDSMQGWTLGSRVVLLFVAFCTARAACRW